MQISDPEPRRFTPLFGIDPRFPPPVRERSFGASAIPRDPIALDPLAPRPPSAPPEALSR